MFLRDIAKDLLKRYGNNLSDVTMVFPGKRARLFLNQYLAEESTTPVWAPNYTTIDELVQRLSPYRKADSITSVCTLYNIYASLVPDAEPLDEFYAWGEIILSDFDDIDKHMAPADKVFHNAYDLENISEEYLTEEQERALQQFFKNFNIERMTRLKEHFLRLWQVMPDLYHGLRQALREQGLLYAGAMYRDVAERLQQTQQPPHPPRGSNETDRLSTTSPTNSPSGVGGAVCFAGFNILDESTEAIFNYFEKEHTTLFYWDYDRYYVEDTMCEAGLFMRKNLKSYPNALPAENFDNLRHIKDITYIATSTNNAQSRYIPQWIEEHLTEHENETAIVLADEHQLGSVLHSIPEDKPKYINVTMGFPLSDTPVFSFVNELLSLYIDGYDATTNRYRHTITEKVKRHPYFAYTDERIFDPQPCEASSLLTRLISIIDQISRHFAAKKSEDVYDQLYTEALFQTHLTLTKFLQQTTTAPSIPPTNSPSGVGGATLRRLLRQVLSSTSIPFHGEPAIGMQVMGLLESRNIDFRHLLMMSVGEGILPKKNDDTSLIPYNLRESFGLTTMRHRVSVFAYYFFRLISRTEHVTLMYNENASGVAANEMSRFLRQLMAETDLPIKFVRLMPTNKHTNVLNSDCVAKTDEIIDKLREQYINNPNHHLSPTAINTLLNCSMQFYFKYVAHLRVEQDTEDGITTPLFGTIFHDAANLLYNHLMQQGTHKVHTFSTEGSDPSVEKVCTTITADMLQGVLDSPEMRLKPFIDASLILNLFANFDDTKREEEFQRLKSLSLEDLRAYVHKFFEESGHASMLTGLNHIARNVLIDYLTSLIRYDHRYAPFTLVGLEVDHYYKLEIAPGEFITTGGRIDRLERDSNGLLTVVDYKTGGSPTPIKDIEAIFKHTEKGAGYFLQTFIYALAASQDYNNEPCRPTLLYIKQSRHTDSYQREMFFGKAENCAPVLDIRTHADEFVRQLQENVQKLFSKEHPFRQAENDKACKFCDFRALCNRTIRKED